MLIDILQMIDAIIVLHMRIMSSHMCSNSLYMLSTSSHMHSNSLYMLSMSSHMHSNSLYMLSMPVSILVEACVAMA